MKIAARQSKKLTVGDGHDTYSVSLSGFRVLVFLATGDQVGTGDGQTFGGIETQVKAEKKSAFGKKVQEEELQKEEVQEEKILENQGKSEWNLPNRILASIYKFFLILADFCF